MFCKVTPLKVKPQHYSYLHHLFLFIVFVFMTAIVCQPAQATENETTAAGKTETMTLKGQFLGSSYKAKLISIQVGDRIVLIPYDSKTTGLKGVAKRANVILHYQGEGDKKIAVAILPELVGIPAGVAEIQPTELLEIIANPPRDHGYLLIDCRPAEFYAESHLPTAVSIPWNESKKRKAALLPDDKETLLIFYCLGSTCLLGPNSAALAAESGYKNIKVLLSELAAWQDNGGQLFSTDSYIANGNIVLIDLRAQEEAEAGHIPGAANIPFSDLEEAEYDFPAKKSAPVVVYGNGNDATASISVIKGWGFHQVSVVKGGYGGWIRRGNTIKTGAAPASIKWQRKLGEGEISIKKFKEVLENSPAGVLIIDVRTNAEAAKGKLKNSAHIPLNELEIRLAEIPEDKEIILHCTTGARAKMAYSFLSQHRAKVRFLFAKITCKNEKCRIRT
jgi:rhodanese-related sulfurtransferase